MNNFDLDNKTQNKISGNGNGNDITLPHKIGIIYSDVKREYFPTEQQYITEKDADKDANIFAKYVDKLGIATILYPADTFLPQKLKADKPDMVINLVGSVRGNESLAATIPGVLELLRIPYTGAGMLGESLGYNKFLVKKLLQQNGVPVPAYQLFSSHTDILDPTLRFPLISKLNEIHGAVEITRDAVSENEKHLRNRIKNLIKDYDQGVLVEEFIVGREIACYVLEGLNKKTYMGEKVFSSDEKYVFASFESQWLGEKEMDFYYQKYDDSILRGYVRKAFSVTKMADYGKFDVRLDSSGRYYFLDSNSNPSLGPKESQCPISFVLDLYGVTFSKILLRLIQNTMAGAKYF